MKALILAAGLGTRLRPITDTRPKCMAEVNGIKIIDRQLSNLQANGLSDIYVISGYKSEILSAHINDRWPSVRVITNRDYDRTNNMYSLFLAREFLDGSNFLLMNGDVYFDAGITAGLLSCGHEDAIACDKSQYLEESMKVIYDGRKITHISKTITPEEYYAVSIDIYRISARTSSLLFRKAEETIKVRGDSNSWTEKALDEIFPDSDFQPYVIHDRWYEIDSLQDLEKASEIFRGDSL